jgi:hypothetical protein
MIIQPIPGLAVIGLGHKARHGKDTAVAAMVRAFPSAGRFGFADDLYAIARVRHGMVEKDAPLLQQLGLEYRKTFGADVWIRAVYAKLLTRPPGIAVALIPDCRFPNELDFVKRLGGTTVRIDRVFPNGRSFLDSSRDPHHVSETSLDGATWDRVLINLDGHPRVLEHEAVDLLFDVLAQTKPVHVRS